MATLALTLTSGKQISASSKPSTRRAPWTPSGNAYTVTVKVGNKWASFPFFDSLAAQQSGEPCDLRSALACLGSDASAADYCDSVAGVMQEFGYTDKREAERVYKGLQKAAEQAERLGLDSDDLSELADY